ncbi:glycosyltransferase [bacterium]|nr:glycosyltransferase [bacterium]
MSKAQSPDLSVIIITPDFYKTIRKTIGTLRKQTVVNRMEIIIVVPDKTALEPDYSELSPFLCYSIIEIETITSLGTAKAVGIREASAPLIALIEEHVYTDPGWAEALINAHKQPWAAVGPVVRNANPKGLMSWADFIITYGHWMEPLPAGVTDILPGHNSSYKRDILLSYGDSLGSMLEVEAILHGHLQSKGYQIYLEPDAIIYHLGFSRLIPSLPVQFHIGRLFAADRAKQWSPLRRLLYTGGSPLIPLIRLFRLTYKLIRSGAQRRCPYAALPATIPGLVSSALGELAGYARGPGDSKKQMINYEFHRDQQ